MRGIRKTTILVAAATLLSIAGTGATATAAAPATTYNCGSEYYNAYYSYFGWYTGNTYVPSYNGFSYAAIEAQCLLNRLGYGLTVDGVYGSNTWNAVKNFQQNHQWDYGLTADGYMGPKTWPALHTIAP